MNNWKKGFILIIISFMTAACTSSSKSLQPKDFHSDISMVNQNIEAVNETIPNDAQHIKFQSLKETESGNYKMIYTMDDKIVSVFNFHSDQSLYKVVLGNSKQESYKYSEVGVPVSIIITYLLGDFIPEDNDTEKISVFLTSCVKDEKMKIKTNAYTISLKKDSKQQTIVITIQKIT